MHICHVTSAHPAADTRISNKEAASAILHGHEVTLVAPARGTTPPEGLRYLEILERTRAWRLSLGAFEAISAAGSTNADIYQLHDPELLPWAWRLRRGGACVIFDMHENVPAQVMSKHWIPRILRGLVSRLVGLAFRLTLPTCDAVVHATPGSVLAWLKRPQILVQNYPPASFLGPDAADKARPDGYITLVYSGAISRIRGIEQMVAAMSAVGSTGEYRLVMIGAFSPASLLDDIARLDGWEFVDYRGQVPIQDVPGILRASDIALLLFQDAPNHRDSYPNKLFEYMGAGVPVIASDFPTYRAIVEEAECGLLVDPSDVTAIAQAIRALAADADLRSHMGRSGREAVLREYRWEEQYARLEDLYASLRR